MSIKDFSAEQKQSLLDLAVLAMYADGHLAVMEDDRLQRLLATMGYDSEYDRRRYYDGAVARVRQHSQSVESARSHAATLAGNFTTAEQRHELLMIVDDLLASDGSVAPKEITYLEVVRKALQP
jgi:uncharacterized tellurite resistance protein B-like protein